MTNEEAIYLLRNTAWIAPSLEPIDEAIEMACEALRKTEPQTCDDCIWSVCIYIKIFEDEPQTEREGE